MTKYWMMDHISHSGEHLGRLVFRKLLRDNIKFLFGFSILDGDLNLASMISFVNS